MSADTQTPPECCPICQSGHDQTSDHRKSAATGYDCGIVYREYKDKRLGDFEWIGQCRNATAAALRVGATLEPTPLELARAALVDAAKEWQWQAQPEDDHDHPEAVLYRAVDAYLALLEPAP